MFVSFELLILGSRHGFKLLLYWFPVAAVANCHKLRGLKEHILVIVVLRIQSPKWVSLASNHSVSRMSFLLEASFQRLPSFSRLEAACPPWFMACPHQWELMRGWFSLSARISDTGLRPPPRLRLLVMRWHWAQPDTPRHFPILRPNDEVP